MRTELYYSNEEGQQDRKAFSQEQTFFIAPEVGLSYRFDYFDIGQGLGHSTEHAFGISYDPNPSVRLRLDAHHQLLPNSPDVFNFLNFSFSVSF